MMTTIGWRTPYRLQPVPRSLFAGKTSYTHEVTLERNDKEISFVGQAQWREGTLTLAGLAPFGRLFMIEFDDNLNAELSEALPAVLKAGHLLGDFELIFWPAESLVRGGLDLEEGPGQRVVSRKGKAIATISYDAQTGEGLARAATLINHSRHYSVHVVPMASAPGDE